MYLQDLPCLDEAAEDYFPPSESALNFPSGLLAWGGELSPERLLAAYRRGIFPWFSEGEPILWWSPSPRCVLYPADVYVSTRSRRRLRQGRYEISADRAFDDVIDHCAAPQPGRRTTWITSDMLAAYRQLHQLGHAHSVEAWLDGELVGGVYGISIGRMFFGESMFSRKPDASKIALITLCRRLSDWGFGPIDCQVVNPHLTRMGAVEIERDGFEAQLEKYTALDFPGGSWRERFGAES